MIMIYLFLFIFLFFFQILGDGRKYMVKSKFSLYIFFLLVQIYKISLIFVIIYIIMVIILAGCRPIFTLPPQASRIYKRIKKSY